ncbi:MAG: hypothetical protein AAGI53_11545 [Planctomycetota bacterium]
MSRATTQRRAFSLLEVLLALGLIVALSASIYTFLFELLDRRSRVLEETSAAGASSVLFDHLQSALAGAVVSAVDESGKPMPGLSGSSTEITVRSRAVIGVDADNASPRGDVRVSQIRFDAESGTLSASAWGGFGSREGSDPILENLRDVRLRYHDGDRWSDSFNSVSAGQLPMLVELRLWAGRPPDPEADIEEADVGSPEDLFADGPRAGVASDAALLEEPDLGPPSRQRVFIIPSAGEPIDNPEFGDFSPPSIDRGGP